MSFDSLLNTVCDIEVNTPTQDTDSGEWADSWAALYEDVPCPTVLLKLPCSQKGPFVSSSFRTCNVPWNRFEYP